MCDDSAMRILVVNSHHYRRGGDSGQFLDHIAALEGRGHEVAAFCMHHEQNLPSVWSQYWAPHVEYRGALTVGDRLQAAWRSIHSAEAARGMTRLLEDFEPDVVHFHSVQHHLTLAVVEACLSAGVPTVWTLHDYRAVCPASALLSGGEVCEQCAGGRYWHCVARRCKSGELTRSAAGAAESYLTRMRGTLSRVDCYVAPSDFLGRKVLDMGLAARRLEVVPNPAWGDVSAIAAAGERQGLLFVGRLSPEKGVAGLIRAVAGLADAPLRIVGDGPEEPGLRALATGLRADVTFEGWVPPHSVRRHMDVAGMLCAPSVCYENCPGVVLEAMSAGLPVVASDIGGLGELLDEGRAGWLAPAGDIGAWRRVLAEALADPGRTAEQAARALERVRTRHDPEQWIAHIERIYTDLRARAPQTGRQARRRLSAWRPGPGSRRRR